MGSIPQDVAPARFSTAGDLFSGLDLIRLIATVQTAVGAQFAGKPIALMVPSLDARILRHFGLRENPFGVTPDPRFLFMSGTHREALASLVNGIECGFGFQVLVAQPGMGKTTLLFDFLERFSSSRTAFLFQQQHDSRELIQSLLVELKSDSGETSHAKLYSQLNHLLSEAAQTRERVIVVVDEAQNLEDSLLETLRQLSNFETARSKLLQIVLAGQPQLAKKLARPEQEQLRQRVSTIARLSPFGLDETRAYLSHRLKVAGYHGPEFFTTSALQSMWSSARGIPRNINTLCFNAMLVAFAQGAKRVDEPAIKEAAQDLDLDYVLADVAGSHPPRVGLGDLGLPSGIGLDDQKPSRHQPPAATRLSPNNGQRPSIPKPLSEYASERISDLVPASASVVSDNRESPSNGQKHHNQQLAVPQSSRNNGLQPSIAEPGARTVSAGVQSRRPAAAPAPANQHPQPAMPKAGPGGRTGAGKKILWASLVAAAVGAGVLFGHGLGARSRRQAEERPESLSEPVRVQDAQPVMDAPLTKSRNDKESSSAVNDGPEVVVRTFPQSAPSPGDGGAQQNVKTIFFDEDSAAVSSRYDSTLQRVADLLTASPQSAAIIEGHTDNSGEEPYNWDLSTRRAAAVKNMLVDYGISAARLSTVGAGSSAPLASNATSSGRATNRRVEVRITQPEASLTTGSNPQ